MPHCKEEGRIGSRTFVCTDGALHWDVILLDLSQIGNWRIYNISLLFYILLILVGVGKMEWCSCLPRMVISKLSHII